MRQVQEAVVRGRRQRAYGASAGSARESAAPPPQPERRCSLAVGLVAAPLFEAGNGIEFGIGIGIGLRMEADPGVLGGAAR